MSGPPRRGDVGWDAVALMGATVAGAGMSLAFWVVAARLYPASVVGRAAAQSSTLNLLAGVAQLNLMNVLLRFLPVSGRRTSTVLGSSYGAIAGAAIALGLVAGVLDISGVGSTIGTFSVIVAVVVFALFVVEDGVLTALGRAREVPLTKIAAAGAKLILLVLLVGTGGSTAVLVAWTVPTFVVAVAVTVAVFVRARRVSAEGAEPALPPAGRLGSFVAAEYLNNTFSNVVVFLPPVLVLHLLTATDSAYFNIPWLVVITTQTLLWNIVMSLVAESARSPRLLAAHFRRILSIGTLVVVGAPIVIICAGPTALGFQGPGYAESGTGLLVLLALSLPLTGVVVFYGAICLIETRMWHLVVLNAASAVALTLASTALLPSMGIVSVGWAYLAIQAGAALVAAVALVRRSRAARGADHPADGSPQAAVAAALVAMWDRPLPDAPPARLESGDLT